MDYSSGHQSKLIECRWNCTALEKQEKLRFQTLKVLLLQNKASKSGTIFLGDPVYEHFIKTQIWILLYQKAEEQ